MLVRLQPRAHTCSSITTAAKNAPARYRKSSEELRWPGGLLLSLKNEIVRIAPRGRVNAVAPGWTETPMTRGLVDPGQVRDVSRTMSLRKVASPEDVAAQVLVLSSDTLSGHVTGQLIVEAGGMEGRTVHPD